MAFMLSLCATCRCKTSQGKRPRASGSVSPSSRPADSIAKQDKETTGGGAAAAQSLAMAELEGEKFSAAAAAMTVIELSPDVATHGPMGPSVLPPSASTRRRRSMSLKGLQDKLRSSWRERKGGAADEEESIWTKTIILGEKCRVSEEEEEIVAVTLVDEKGHRQTIHTRRTSRPSSRHGSFECADREDREASRRSTGARAAAVFSDE